HGVAPPAASQPVVYHRSDTRLAQIGLAALMLAGDPRAHEETRSMFRALAALKAAEKEPQLRCNRIDLDRKRLEVRNALEPAKVASGSRRPRPRPDDATSPCPIFWSRRCGTIAGSS